VTVMSLIHDAEAASECRYNQYKLSRGSVMNGSRTEGSGQSPRVLNAVPLQNAVLCAECDVVSDSPHDVCLVCGSRSLFNIARVFGGRLPRRRTTLVVQEVVETPSREVVVPFPKPHRLRKRARVASHQLPLAALDDDEVDRGVFFGPTGR
jgi:hypothetical protein